MTAFNHLATLATLFRLSPDLVNQKDEIIESALKAKLSADENEGKIRLKMNLLDQALYNTKDIATLFVILKFWQNKENWQASEILDNLLGVSENKSQQYQHMFKQLLLNDKKGLQLDLLSIFIPISNNDQTIPIIINSLNPELFTLEKLSKLCFQALEAKNWQALSALIQKSVKISKHSHMHHPGRR